MWDQRRKIYRKIEKDRKTKLVSYVTGDRRGLETQISPEVIDLFVALLDKIGPTKRISLLLHTNGGNTSAAWRLINLINTFCDELEVIIPTKALSAGTLIALGASKIVMTKQAALGPIDPSLDHALNPQVPQGRVPVSVEAVRGYLDEAKNFINNHSSEDLSKIYLDLSNKIHPLVLGQIFRTRQQIRDLAKRLLDRHFKDSDKVSKLIDFLCSESGSHDYTINRREAIGYGLNVEKPTQEFYRILNGVSQSWSVELELLNPYSPHVLLGANHQTNYELRRALIESTDGGCFAFVSEGSLTSGLLPDPSGIPQQSVTDTRTFEGWKSIG